MRFLVVYFSHTGNNRLLATAIARRLNCETCAIVEASRRTMFTIMLDMLFRRTPRIKPLEKNLTDYDHIVFLAPIWNFKIANPMVALLQREKANISGFSFITLCGNARPGQRESIADQLFKLVGKRPKAVQELRVCDLVPEEKRDDVRVVSAYHVTESELTSYESGIAEFIHELKA